MQYVQVDYANYLMSFTWDTFHTQTFRRRRNDPFNSAQAWWKVMELRLGATRAFTAVEKHKLGGVHLHSLVAYELTEASEYRHTINAGVKYCNKAFGWTNCSNIINQATVSLYCAKYVKKESGEYFFFGHWPEK